MSEPTIRDILDALVSFKDEVSLRFDRIDERFEQVDRRFEQVDRRFEQVDRRFERVEGRIEEVESGLRRLEIKVDAGFATLGSRIGELERRRR